MFDIVLVARFDRFARSTRHLITALEEFQSLGVDFISLTESIDTSSAMGRMVFTILAAVAELERNIIRERVQAGVDRGTTSGQAIRSAWCDCGPRTDREPESRRSQYQIDREGVPHRPIDGEEHSVEGGEMWSRRYRNILLISCH